MISHVIIKTRGRHRDVTTPVQQSLELTRVNAWTLEEYEEYKRTNPIQPGDIVCNTAYATPVNNNMQLHMLLRWLDYPETLVIGYRSQRGPQTVALGQLFSHHTMHAWIHHECLKDYRKITADEAKVWLAGQDDYLRHYQDKYATAKAG